MNVEDLIGATFALCYRVNHKKNLIHVDDLKRIWHCVFSIHQLVVDLEK